MSAENTSENLDLKKAERIAYLTLLSFQFARLALVILLPLGSITQALLFKSVFFYFLLALSVMAAALFLFKKDAFRISRFCAAFSAGGAFYFAYQAMQSLSAFLFLFAWVIVYLLTLRLKLSTVLVLFFAALALFVSQYFI